MTKRFFSLFMVIAICLSMVGTTAFAAENTDFSCVSENVIEIQPTNLAVPYAIYPSVSGTVVPSNNHGTTKIYPTCTQGNILKLHVSTSCASDGVVELYLYNKNGTLVSHDWIMGPNDEGVFNLPLFSTYGTYTLEVHAYAIKSPMTITAYLSN